MGCSPFRSQAWLDAHSRDLEGLEAEDAVALVELAGLRARVIHHRGGGGAVLQEQRDDTVNLWLTEAGSVASIDAG